MDLSPQAQADFQIYNLQGAIMINAGSNHSTTEASNGLQVRVPKVRNI
jgi:hypothetical protein